MKNPSDTTGGHPEKFISQDEHRQEALLRLRHQSRFAAMLLFSPWLTTVFLFWSFLQDEPITVLALLPGLVVAIYLQQYLSGHLASNHRFFEEGQLFSTLGAANWITLLRAGAIVALAGFLPLAMQSQGLEISNGLSWAPGLIYLGISLADLCDGFVARRQGKETELGKRLDIETDAAGLLVASLLAVALGQVPVIYLLVGLAYYPFILGISLRQKSALPVVALRSRPYSRIIAGCQMGLVGMVLLPIFNPPFTFVAAYIFMTPLLVGFLRDWLVVSCRIKTDADQQAGLDHWLRSLMTKVPIVLRLIILVGGIYSFIDPGDYRLPLAWQLALSLCILAAIVGFMGRSAALFLVLLLGSTLSPLGTSFFSGTLFVSAAALMLSGTGTMSLWAPEDRILYRRNENAVMKSRKVP
ncbi:CDP-alcohol phosphatidyltransferase family protein [Desulfopila sp. IMCC35006]|uniref:CDP-alcohol phosphatidyltransferase family protein n=1 Tax=Desulfopila sp. IMCC35006 TaxID=2569542 RepID=UPI0010ABE986|nr:CDP-alcohol phosphatidyltransferase family protein [Desulfopila sp. IMCC35006]TKB27652.1 CDP-alcohol phosphatidyltransferase family protein [Desulfopila sp. IMCC35006]